MMYPTAKDCKEDEPFISNIERCLDFIKNLNIATWLQDHPNWVDPNAAVSSRASKSPHVATCAQSVASIQDASVATSSTSHDGRVARHKIWGAVLDTSSTTPCIVVPVMAPDFEDILRASGSKNDHARMFAESLSNFYEEKTPMSGDKVFLDKEVSVLNLLPPDLALEETTA
eukprot:733623-Ditylum_brightwellii.AAC.2